MGSENNDLTKSEVKVTTGNVNNSIMIKDSSINIPNVVATGLTNLGTGTAVAAGLKAGSTIVKTSGFSPAAKLGTIFAAGLGGAVIVTGGNVVNSISQKKADLAYAKSIQSNPKLPDKSNSTTPKNNSDSNGDVFDSFSIEPSVDIDNVMTLLNSSFILQFCILYLL
jgi:hypothetical protein